MDLFVYLFVISFYWVVVIVFEIVIDALRSLLMP